MIIKIMTAALVATSACAMKAACAKPNSSIRRTKKASPVIFLNSRLEGERELVRHENTPCKVIKHVKGKYYTLVRMQRQEYLAAFKTNKQEMKRRVNVPENEVKKTLYSARKEIFIPIWRATGTQNCRLLR